MWRLSANPARSRLACKSEIISCWSPHLLGLHNLFLSTFGFRGTPQANALFPLCSPRLHTSLGQRSRRDTMQASRSATNSPGSCSPAASSPSSVTLWSDVFGLLPAELLLPILNQAPDLSSLWSLINASPAAARMFHAAPLEVIEAVMAATMHTPILSLALPVLRGLAFSQFPNLEEARWLPSSSLPPWPSQTSMQRTQHPLWPRRFLRTAHRIHSLAHGCVEHYIASTNSANIRELVEFGPVAEGGHDDYLGRYATAESRAFEPVLRSTHSWWEEQRAARCLWHVCLYFQLQRARKTGQLDWPQDHLLALASTSLFDFDMADRPQPERGLFRLKFRHQQLLTILEYLDQLPGFASGIDDPLLLIHPIIADRYFDRSVCRQKPRFQYEDAPNSEECMLQEIVRPKIDIWQGRIFQNTVYRILQGIPFEKWRHFGFALWDMDRIEDLGLGYKSIIPIGNRGYYRWYSIMDQNKP